MGCWVTQSLLTDTFIVRMYRPITCTQKKKHWRGLLNLMIRFTLLLSSIIRIVFFIVGILNAQTKKDYADWLYKQEDYFRAISVYKELLFFTKEIDSLNLYQYQIGKAYFRSGRYNNSIREFASILERSISEELKSNCLNYISLNYLNLSLPNQALFYATEALKIDTAKSSFVTGLIYLNLYDWEKAKYFFQKTVMYSSSNSISELAKENLNSLKNLSKLSYKRPIFALMLSAVLPGAGQYYSGHFIDAIQAFALVGAFSYMSYLAYKYDHSQKTGYYNFSFSIFLTSIFYIANLIGAERTATYYNLKMKQDFVRKINERSFLVFD